MIVAIERNKFNYLYKYNQLFVDYNHVIDLSFDQLKRKLKAEFKFVVMELNRILPSFEQDHEVLLVNIDKANSSIQGRLLIKFNAVLDIYPLSETGKQLLDGRLNKDFRINEPLFERVVEEVKIIRSIESRNAASSSLLSHFFLADSIDAKAIDKIGSALGKILSDKNQGLDLDSYLEHLLAYNKTPSYIPQGNVEYLCKIGGVAMKHLGKPEDAFTNGPYYKFCLKNKDQINAGSLEKSYEYFLSIPDADFKSSYNKVVEIISVDFGKTDIFKASYFFLAFKSILNKNEGNLMEIEKEVLKLKADDEEVAALVVTMIGYSFSFEVLYESIHRLNKAPIFKSSSPQTKQDIVNREMTPIIADEKKVINKEVISKPITIYQNPITEIKPVIEKVAEKENEAVVYEERLPENISEDGKIFKPGVSVKEFKKWVARNNFSKPNKGLWDNFIDDYLIGNVEFITLDELVSKIELIQGFKDKALKTKKDRDSLKEFFASNNWSDK